MKSRPTKVFVIRFAKGIVETPLYFSPYQGQVAFVDDLNKAIGWPTKEEAEFIIKAILDGCPDKLVRGKLEKDLEVEEHEFGGNVLN